MATIKAGGVLPQTVRRLSDAVLPEKARPAGAAPTASTRVDDTRFETGSAERSSRLQRALLGLPAPAVGQAVMEVAPAGARLAAPGTVAQENAGLLLQKLSAPRTQAEAAALTRLLKAAGVDVALAQEPSALVTPENATKVARHFESKGLSLDGAGLKAFQRHHLMAPQQGMTAHLARAYAKALGGKQTLFDVRGALDERQEKAALRVFRAMKPARAAAMMQALGVKVQLEGDALRQKRQLGNVFVSGEAVRTLAREAKERDISLTPKGIQAFRKQHGLGRGSALDGPTLRRLQVEVGPIGPRPRGERQKAEWYRRIVQSQGGTWRTGVNEVNVVGLRGYDVKTGLNKNAFGKWNDTLAFVWKKPGGAWEVREFRATTEPGVKRYHDNDDYNRDGRPDTAHLRPGQYSYRLGTHKGRYGAGNPTYNVQVDRDFNGDGRISAAERKESIRRDTRGFGINIHWQSIPGDVGLNSLGCQVAKLGYDEFRRRITPIFELNRGLAKYNLVEARKVLT